MLDMSRWVVGSSINSRLGGSSKSLTRASRLFSPPLRTLTLLKTSSPRNRKQPSKVRTNCSVTLRGVSKASSSTVRSGLRPDHISQQFKESGFARAVGADQDDSLPTFGLEIHSAVNHSLTIRVVNA